MAHFMFSSPWVTWQFNGTATVYADILGVLWDLGRFQLSKAMQLPGAATMRAQVNGCMR